MDEQHRGSNPGSSEASKRPLSASAQKESQKEHTQKTKVSAVMASVQQVALFGGTPAGPVHAPPVEARRYRQPPVLKTAVHRDRHPQKLPLSSLLCSTLRFTPLLLLVPPWFLHRSQIPARRRVLRDRLSQKKTLSNLLSSKLRNRPLLEKPPPWNPPRTKTNQKMCGQQTTTQSTAMAPLTRLLLGTVS